MGNHIGKIMLEVKFMVFVLLDVRKQIEGVITE